MRIHPLTTTLVALPVLAAVAGPYWLGARAEVAYRATVAEMERQPQALHSHPPGLPQGLVLLYRQP